jgi:hypothetical protein
MRLSKIFMPVVILVVLLAGILSGCVPPVPEVIEVSGVEITEEDQTMKVDETLPLNAVISPEDADNKSITWESDNPDVAAVDENGLVTALKKGVANITVTTEDGSFTDTIKITVTKPYTPSTPTIKKYEVILGAVELNTPTPQPPSPLGFNIGLTRQETTPAADIAGVEIEIFSNEERTNSVLTITTGQDGTAIAKLPTGTYYYSASAEGYVDFLSELYQYFSATLDISIPEPGSFIVKGPSEEINLFPMLKVWKVSFEAYEHAEQIPAGLNRANDQGLPLDGVTIDIYEDKDIVSSSGRTSARGTIPPLVSITTGSDGTAETELPNGNYSFTASKEGYVEYSETAVLSIPRTTQNYFFIEDADKTETIQVPMEPLNVELILHEFNLCEYKTWYWSEGYTSPHPIANFKIEQGDNRLLVVGLSYKSIYERIYSVKFGESELTKLAESRKDTPGWDPITTEIWYLKNPEIATADISASFYIPQSVIPPDGYVPSIGLVMGAVQFSNADPDNPFGVPTEESDDDFTDFDSTKLVSIASEKDDIIFSIFCYPWTGSVTSDVNQTDLWNDYITNLNITGAASYKEASSDSNFTDISYQASSPPNNCPYSVIGVAVKPAR